ncbi:MAG: phosphonate ABC transporter, permease protein PhnE [Spirochaetaceae bacterium]|nr:MAG: phosphonate ABC transporter, permease protein PhnE [Spirochaetaceae bacterium]
MDYSPEVLQSYENRPKTLVLKLGITVGILFLFMWSIPAFEGPLVSASGLDIVTRMFRGLINPTWDKLFSLQTFHVPYLMYETVMVAFLGTLIGTLVAIPLSFLGSRNITNSVIAFLVTVVVVLIRTMPFFVIGLIYIRVVGPGVFAGVLTIGFTSTGMITKLYTESVEDMDKGILEALDSTGATAVQKLRVGIVPQLFANFVSHSLYRFDINVRNAIILGLISAGRLGFELQAAIGNFRYRDAGAYLWGIILVVMVIEFASANLRKRLIYG